MNTPDTKPPRTAVTLADIQGKVKQTDYVILPDGRTTICMLTLENGFTVRGESACVVAANFNKALGEKYAYEDAINKCWPLEGYLLAEEIFKRDPAPVLYSIKDVARSELVCSSLAGDTCYLVAMKDGKEFNGRVDEMLNGEALKNAIIDDINKQVLEGAKK